MPQMATLDEWGNMARTHVDEETGTLLTLSAIFFMSFLLIVSFTLSRGCSGMFGFSLGVRGRV